MTFFTLKNITQWIAPSGQGFISNVGNFPIIVNGTLLPLVDNVSHLPIEITPLQWSPKYITPWSSTNV